MSDGDSKHVHGRSCPHCGHDHAQTVDTQIQGRGAMETFAIRECDRWETQRENARAIALYARRMRLAEKCGVTTANSTFETARLPPADEDDDVIVAGGASREPHEVLGVAEDAPDAVVKGAYRELLKEKHPDHGGTAAELKELNWAKDELLD